MSRILDFLETIKHKLTIKEYDRLQNRICYLEYVVEKDFKELKSKQEKKDELLDLYKTVFKNYVIEIDNVRQQQFTFLASEYKIIKGMFNQIKALEEE